MVTAERRVAEILSPSRAAAKAQANNSSQALPNRSGISSNGMATAR